MKSLLTKIIALTCVALLVISLAACGESTDTKETTAAVTATEADKVEETTAVEDSADDAAAALVGSWEYEGSGFVYNFNADGTGTYDLGSDQMKFTYTATDKVLSITYDGMTEPMELEYKLDGDTLNVIDSLGSDTIYYRK